MIDVHKLASEYEFRGDAGDYTPTEAGAPCLKILASRLSRPLDAPQPTRYAGRGRRWSQAYPMEWRLTIWSTRQTRILLDYSDCRAPSAQDQRAPPSRG